jgi:DNA-binding Lrp family transcriptional regulator
MDARAYLLIEADAGEVGAVIRALREVPGIRTADAVTGPYDIIATLETSDQRMIGRLVIDVIHGITGIKRTITCVAIADGWQNTSRGARMAGSAVMGPDQPAAVTSHHGPNGTR